MPQNHPAGREEALNKLWSLIKGIKVAMMTTWDGEQMHARPMHGYQEAFEGKLYFFTRLDSGKTQEIGQYDKLNLSYADPDENTYVSVAGSGSIRQERALMEKYWSRHVSAWFPKGLDDPELAMIEVDAESAQYWDTTNSSMRYLWEITRANMTGSEPNLGENARVSI